MTHEMPIARMNLGPLTTALVQKAKWDRNPHDAYPSGQEWADECERLLEYIQRNRVLRRSES